MKKKNSLRLVCFSFWWRVYSFKWKKIKEKQIKDVSNLEFRFNTRTLMACLQLNYGDEMSVSLYTR